MDTNEMRLNEELEAMYQQNRASWENTYVINPDEPTGAIIPWVNSTKTHGVFRIGCRACAAARALTPWALYGRGLS